MGEAVPSIMAQSWPWDSQIAVKKKKGKTLLINSKTVIKLFHDGEITPLICRANQWTGFYMITASVMKGLRTVLRHFYALKKLFNEKLNKTTSSERKLSRFHV